MIKKSFIFTLTLMTFFTLFVVFAHSQEDMEVVNSDGFSNQRRPPDVFRHDDHNDAAEIEECNECPHKYGDIHFFMPNFGKCWRYIKFKKVFPRNNQ